MTDTTAIAWICTKRTTGDKSELIVPCLTLNGDYVKAHSGHDWQPLYTAAAIAALAGQADAGRADALRGELQQFIADLRARAERADDIGVDDGGADAFADELEARIAGVTP